MKIVLFLFGLFSIIQIGCTKKVDHFKDKQYIISYNIVDEKCEKVLKEFLLPTFIENKEYKISEIYFLDVFLDTLIYKNTLYNYNFYFGVIRISNSGKESMDILHMIPQDGMVSRCESIENNTKLIVNMDIVFHNNALILGLNECFGLDTTIKFREYKNEHVGFYSNRGSTELNGKWKLKKDTYYIVDEEFYNNYWYFTDKNIMLTNDENDTIVKSSYLINGDSLIINSLSYPLQVKTYTNTCIIISEFDTDSINYLFRISE